MQPIPLVDFLYLEPIIVHLDPNEDDYYSLVAGFINQNNIQHFCVPLRNPKHCKWTSLDKGVNSPIIKFLLKIRSAKISVHPPDQYGQKNAFVFEGQTAKSESKADRATTIHILMSYIKKANDILRQANPLAQITGIVLGESLGCRPFENDEETSVLYRKIVKESFDDSFTIGGSNGTIFINERYYQMYDWTTYDKHNPNPWEQFKDSPSELLGYFRNMLPAWGKEAQLKHKQDPAHFYGEPGWWLDKNAMFWWETEKHQTPGVNLHWMFAFSSQTNYNDRLALWSLPKVRELFSRIRSQMTNSGQSAGIALYNNGQPLPRHWLAVNANIPKMPENSNSKPKKLIPEEESKCEFKQNLQNEPKKKPNNAPGNSNSKPKKPIYEESKCEFKPKLQNEPKKKPNNGDRNPEPVKISKPKPESEGKAKTNKEEFVAKYDQNHDIYYQEYYQESRRRCRFFAKKDGQEKNEKETAVMIANLKDSIPGFSEKLSAFKRNKGL